MENNPVSDFILVHNTFKEPTLIRKRSVISVRRYKNEKTLVNCAQFDIEVQESVDTMEKLLNE